MILKKSLHEGVNPASSAAILGLKVVGGKILEHGGRGAIIEKVKKGSIADIEGQLRPGEIFKNQFLLFFFLFFEFLIGDEVIEWNGRTLQGKSYQEVYDIIAESKQENQVELIVSRSMGNRRAAQASWRHSHTTTLPRGNIVSSLLYTAFYYLFCIVYITSCIFSFTTNFNYFFNWRFFVCV